MLVPTAKWKIVKKLRLFVANIAQNKMTLQTFLYFGFLFWFPKSADSMEKSLNIFRREYLGIFGIFANNSAFF